MKKLLLLITVLFLLVSANGQILRYSNYTAPVPPIGDDYYAEFQTVYDAFTTKPHADTATIMEAMVYSLDTMDFAGGASVWDRMDIFSVYANDDGTDALINWVNPGTFDADNVSATVFTRWEGFTGDGVADYISTNWVPSTDASNYAQNSGTMGIYIRDSNVDPNGGHTFGVYSVIDPRITLKVMYHDEASSQWAINATGGTSETTPNASVPGFYMITRRGATDSEYYKNGTSLEADDIASSGLPTSEIHVLKANGSATYGTHQASIFFIMNGITDAEATAINTVIETFMDALGKGVE